MGSMKGKAWMQVHLMDTFVFYYHVIWVGLGLSFYLSKNWLKYSLIVSGYYSYQNEWAWMWSVLKYHLFPTVSELAFEVYFLRYFSILIISRKILKSDSEIRVFLIWVVLMITLQLLPYDSCIGVTNGAVNVVVTMGMSSTRICHLYF